MKRSILGFSFIYSLLSCNPEGNPVKVNTPDISMNVDSLAHASGIFKGLYHYDGTNRIFADCEHPELKHLIENKSNQIDTLYKSILPQGHSGEAIYLEIKAETHPSQNKNFPEDVLVIKEFIKAEQRSQENNCN